jgi:hypothetical protein
MQWLDTEQSDFDKSYVEGEVWRPRFLINVISANDRFSRVKPADNGQT